MGQLRVSNFTLILLIPLVLSIGIAPFLLFVDFSQEADATKAVGPKGAKSYGSKNSQVCGDRLCSEVAPTPQASSSSRVTPSTPIPEKSVEEIEEKIAERTMEEKPMDAMMEQAFASPTQQPGVADTVYQNRMEISTP